LHDPGTLATSKSRSSTRRSRIGRTSASSFISQACSGDDELRSEVESLIASHEESGSFIDQPAFEAAASLLTREKRELSAGQMIGFLRGDLVYQSRRHG
jgi:hypothetical protein